MHKLRKKAAGLLLVTFLTLALTGCGSKPKADPNDPLAGTVTASGSTALLPLVTAAKEMFEEKHANVTVNVSGGGSFNGLAQVASGAVQIGNSDVPATGDAAKNLVEFKVAVAPFVIIVHKENPVDDLSIDQLARILRGEITNWKDVGGPDLPITVISRSQSSGSRATIVARVLKGQGDITKSAVVQDSNGKVRDAVQYTPGAIGYVDAAYYQPAKVKGLNVDGVPFSQEAVIQGRYPIFSYGYMYTKGEPTGVVKEFLQFILSPEFQEEVVEEHGFVPIHKMPKP